jgi:hypothetical protein
MNETMVYFERKKKCVWNKLIETKKWLNHEENEMNGEGIELPERKVNKDSSVLTAASTGHRCFE